MSRTICGICWCTYDDDTGKCDCPLPVVRDDAALLRQALEALDSADWYIDQLEMLVYSSDDTGTHEERAKVQAAIAALRERLGETK